MAPMNHRGLVLLIALVGAVPCASRASLITSDSMTESRFSAMEIVAAETSLNLYRPTFTAGRACVSRTLGNTISPAGPESLLRCDRSENGSMSLPTPAFGSVGWVAIVTTLSVHVPSLISNSHCGHYQLSCTSADRRALLRPPQCTIRIAS